MNFSAITHRSAYSDCYALSSNEIIVNLRTGKDITSVALIHDDPYAGGCTGHMPWSGREEAMIPQWELRHNRVWSIRLRPKFKREQYYFRLCAGEETFYMFEDGFYTREEMEKPGRLKQYYRFPWLNAGDVIAPPAWVGDTVWYQIMPDRFRKGSDHPRRYPLRSWSSSRNIHFWDTYGGDLKGITEKLPYLKELGITALYLNPIFEAASNHRYNTADYLRIDPMLGTEEDFRQLCADAAQRGIRIMLDGVFNHSGWFFDKWQDVWKNREKSEYKDWFMINDFNFVEPSFGYGKGNSGTGKFFSFAFVDFMPKLNTNNPEVRKYIIDVCKMWVREYDIDGLRLDVANEISHVFCQELNVAMKSMKPDFYIVGEIWHNSQPWLRGQEYDSVMNYPLQNAIADFCCTDDMTAKEFEYAINRCYSMYYRQVNRVLFNQMDSHDTIRILNRCDGNKVRARQALALMFAMTGSVCIYYGTEIMLEGSFDPDNRRCMPWKEIEEGRFNDDMEFMKSLISLRKNHPAMTSSRYDFVYDESNPDGKERTVKILKTAEDKSEKICVEINSKMTETSCHKENILFNEEGILIYRVE